MLKDTICSKFLPFESTLAGLEDANAISEKWVELLLLALGSGGRIIFCLPIAKELELAEGGNKLCFAGGGSTEGLESGVNDLNLLGLRELPRPLGDLSLESERGGNDPTLFGLGKLPKLLGEL